MREVMPPLHGSDSRGMREANGLAWTSRSALERSNMRRVTDRCARRFKLPSSTRWAAQAGVVMIHARPDEGHVAAVVTG
jgi:hypothetical protein